MSNYLYRLACWYIARWQRKNLADRFADLTHANTVTMHELRNQERK